MEVLIIIVIAHNQNYMVVHRHCPALAVRRSGRLRVQALLVRNQPVALQVRFARAMHGGVMVAIQMYLGALTLAALHVPRAGAETRRILIAGAGIPKISLAQSNVVRRLILNLWRKEKLFIL